MQYLLTQSHSNEAVGTSLKKITGELGLSLNAVRQHLTILEKEGLVFRREKRGRTGRPAIVYHLHEKGMDTFPKAYDDFSLILLEILEKEYGNEIASNLLGKVGESITAGIKSEINVDLDKNFDESSLKDKLELIVQIFTTRGKYTFLEETEESFALINYNCLYYRISKTNPLICNIDREVISTLIGLDVTKEHCRREGANCCLYRIIKPRYQE